MTDNERQTRFGLFLIAIALVTAVVTWAVMQ